MCPKKNQDSPRYPHTIIFVINIVSSEWIGVLRAISFHLPGCLFFHPRRRPTNIDHDAAQYLALPYIQANNSVRTLAYRFFDKSIDSLVARLVYDARHALRLTPGNAKSTRDVLDKGFRVFARGGCSTMDGSEDADDAVTRQV